MQALYEAIRQGGSGITRTQLMRLAYPSIKALRSTRSSWLWIAARVEHVQFRGIEEPPPSEADVDAGFAGRSLGPVRSAYVRLVQEEKEESRAVKEDNRKESPSGKVPHIMSTSGEAARVSVPAIRAGPEPEPETPPKPGASLAKASHGSDDAPKTFFNNLQKLSEPST